ncbi:MAG: hypothetical protein AAF655_25710 [Bacteroidota bacterium]
MRQYVLFVLALWMIVGCHVPYAIIRQQPVQEDPVWYQGKAFVSDQNEQVQLVIAFEQQWDRLLIYELEIKNKGSEPILVRPEQIYSMMSPGPDVMTDEIIHAVNPEAKLVTLDGALSRERAYIANSRTASLIGTLANTVGTVAADTPEEAEYYVDEQLELDARDANDEQEFLNNKANLNDQKEVWLYEMLRKTTVHPGESVRGRIAFPSRKVSAYSILHFPYGEQPITIPFIQLIQTP